MISGSDVPDNGLTSDHKRRQIAQILQSKTFERGEQLRKLLEYLVEQTIAGHASKLKEYVIGVEVFDRGEDFDPTTDTIVRVQASHLRKKLKAYYDDQGRRDPIVVTVPTGRYAVTFRENEHASSTVMESVALEPGLLAALELSRRECVARDLPYRTPSFMWALLSAPERFFERCLDRLEPGLAVELRASLRRYLQEVLPATNSVGFHQFEWTDHELVKIAISRAHSSGVSRANEKHCLQALLEGSSKTIGQFRAYLGARLPSFEHIVQEMSVEADPHEST